jgi:hypothetical protein
MTLSTGPLIRLVYPERRLVTVAYILMRWDDAVANGELEPLPDNAEPTLAVAIIDLEDIGQITTDGRLNHDRH